MLQYIRFTGPCDLANHLIILSAADFQCICGAAMFAKTDNRETCLGHRQLEIRCMELCKWVSTSFIWQNNYERTKNTWLTSKLPVFFTTVHVKYNKYFLQQATESALCSQLSLLHCTLSLAAQCIVIGPVGGFEHLCVWVCYHDNLKLHALIFTKLGLWVKLVAISSWWNFGRPAPPGRGSAAGRNFLTPPYYSQCTVFASLWALFFIAFLF